MQRKGGVHLILFYRVSLGARSSSVKFRLSERCTSFSKKKTAVLVLSYMYGDMAWQVTLTHTVIPCHVANGVA